jgi:hypothetical protein
MFCTWRAKVARRLSEPLDFIGDISSVLAFNQLTKSNAEKFPYENSTYSRFISTLHRKMHSYTLGSKIPNVSTIYFS